MRHTHSVHVVRMLTVALAFLLGATALADSGATASTASTASTDDAYRQAIALLASGAPGVRQAFDDAQRKGPMDPRLYLPLARACREHNLPRAAEFYEKYLTRVPSGPEHVAALAELRALDGGSQLSEFDNLDLPRASRRWPVPVGVGVALLLALLSSVVWLRRRPRHSLRELAATAPELHPALAYLVGTLRHELLKHRVGATRAAARAVVEGAAEAEQRRFLVERLRGDPPLGTAFRAHLAQFPRTLGARFDIARVDPQFHKACREVALIERLLPRVERGEPAAAVRLLQALDGLVALDATLAQLLSELAVTTVDRALLEEAVHTVRDEFASRRVQLDEVVIEAPAETVAVEIFRADLLLVLRNLVRNALAAMDKLPGDAPRRLGLDISLELLPTGIEMVRLRVSDTSHALPPTERRIRLDRGLGLVMAALDRYDGSLEVLELPDAAADGFHKAVVLRFFRAFDHAFGHVSAEVQSSTRERAA